MEKEWRKDSGRQQRSDATRAGRMAKGQQAFWKGQGFLREDEGPRKNSGGKRHQMGNWKKLWERSAEWEWGTRCVKGEPEALALKGIDFA